MPATATKKAEKAQTNGSATITADQAKDLLEAEASVQTLKAELEAAEEKRQELRKELRSRVPLSRDKDEKGKRIRSVAIGGIKVRITPSMSGERFSLKRYREAGHKITKEMRQAITSGRPYDRWTVKKASGA
jgi:hypothetical protein